jgi:Fe2+ transport system protein FeoA
MLNTKVKFLKELKRGDTAKVAEIEGGEQTVSRLQTMGIFAGTEITVIQTTKNGPFIIEARGSRVALGKSLTGKIKIETK